MEAPTGEVFVGRERELGQLERALDATQAGSGTTALVTGEAGIGKTRLASELATRARDARFEVLLGRSIDLVGTELPYHPFVEALGSLGAVPRVDGRTAGSQLRMFQETLALLFDRAAAAPLLLVLEDLHWADTSTLDLVVFSRTTPRPPGPAAGDLPRGRALLGRAHAPTRRSASAARARRWCSSSARSSATSWRRCPRPTPTPLRRRR
jgi:hypothetical protein